jgi:hypothetical protein
MASERRGVSIEEVGDCNKALKVAGRLSSVANCVSDGFAAPGSSASVLKETKAVKQIFS